MNTIQMYDAQADSIKIEDIAANYNNRVILRRIKRNSPEALWIQNHHDADGEDCEDYVPESANDMGWLGYFIGKNNQMEALIITPFTPPSGSSVMDVLEPFLTGVNNNRSITHLVFRELQFDLLDGKAFTMLSSFFKNNNNLTKLEISNCTLGVKGPRLLALAIGSNKHKSFQNITLSGTIITSKELVDIITALSVHPHLQHLNLDGNCLDHNSCKALATLLQNSATELQVLDLSNNEIDDAGVKALVPALKNCSHLETLRFNHNSSITTKGWQQFATVLEAPNSNLEELIIERNNVDDEAVAKFASALVNNHSLKTFNLGRMNWSTDGHFAFSKLVCNTASVNSTFLSNHTLRHVTVLSDVSSQPILVLNKRRDKKEVAIIKVLQYHNDFDMTPFFEWEFKVLPLMIDWFKRASAITRMPTSCGRRIRPTKLSSIYQFVRGMPLLYVETCQRKELKTISKPHDDSGMM